MSEHESDDAAEPPEHLVIAYHERTKHHVHRYAASPGYMDWATQPDPFRRFAGAEVLRLALPASGHPLAYDRIFRAGELPPEPLTPMALSRFLRYSLSLTAWKSAGTTTWPLRANPSSGNLHPTEGYLVLPPVDGLADTGAIYHYAPREHALECRSRLSERGRTRTFETFPPGAFLVGLSSIHWREAWKYGERAFRYCQHDVGHALAGLRVAAAALGWRLTLLAHLPSHVIARTLGLDRASDFEGAELEEPELLALVSPGAVDAKVAAWLPPDIADDCQWAGRANVLSRGHNAEWPIIDAAAAASRRIGPMSLTESGGLAPVPAEIRDPVSEPCLVTAARVIIGRRSAVAMDGVTSVTASAFFNMLARLLPSPDGHAVPWDAVSWRPRLHLVLFVHRVQGLTPGMYALVRDVAQLTTLQAAMRAEFSWSPVPGAPPALPLYLLQAGECRQVAASLSCGQAIAGDGAFSVGMMADFTASLAAFGAPFYRNLFWESGMVGQVLYLEAEAIGLRGTGIGCFFDDLVRDLCGITNRDWQSLYHFTVGGAVDDSRLTTLPAYPTTEDAP